MKRTAVRSAIIVIAWLTALFSVAAPAQAKTEDNAAYSVQEYEAYLAQESPETLTDFNQLSNQEKEHFVTVLSNPQLYTDDNESIAGVESGEDVDVEEDRIATAPRRSNVIDRKVSKARWIKILGVKVIEFRMDLGYQVKGGRVIKINYSSAYTSRNLNPTVQTSTMSKNAWVAARGTSARMSATFAWKVGLKGLWAQITTLHGDITATPSGRAVGKWWGT